MPLKLPDKLPAIEILKNENIFVMDTERASHQDIRPLRIVVLNLMPVKLTTETDLIRLLSNTPLQIELKFMKIKGHTSKNTPVEHMKVFYETFESLKDQKFDGFIVTGAPLEQMEFTDVEYWDELTEILDWARTHVTSSLYICWAALAALNRLPQNRRPQIPRQLHRPGGSPVQRFHFCQPEKLRGIPEEPHN